MRGTCGTNLVIVGFSLKWNSVAGLLILVRGTERRLPEVAGVVQ